MTAHIPVVHAIVPVYSADQIEIKRVAEKIRAKIACLAGKKVRWSTTFTCKDDAAVQIHFSKQCKCVILKKQNPTISSLQI